MNAQLPAVRKRPCGGKPEGIGHGQVLVKRYMTNFDGGNSKYQRSYQ